MHATRAEISRTAAPSPTDLPVGELRRRIRVGLFTNSVAIGGMEKHVEMLARDLDRAVVDVYGICPRWAASDAWANQFAQVADTFVQITPDRRYGLSRQIREIFRFYRQLRAWHLDVLHMHLTTYVGGTWAAVAARLAGVRVLVCTEHLAPEQPLSRLRAFHRNTVSRMYNRIICVSEKNRISRDQYLDTPSACTSVVVNGIDIKPFEPAPPEEVAHLRAELGIPADAPVVGTVVRLVAEKGLPYLFDAMPRVLAEVPNAYLLVVGDGDEREHLEQQSFSLGYRDQVVFAGFQSDPRPFTSLMNAFVLPVPFGSGSIGLLEAMALRRAVIITFGGNGEAVEDGISGLCPPPRDPVALAEAIKRVLADPAFERSLGEAARQRIETDFSAHRVAEELLEIYQHDLDATTRTARGTHV